MTGESFSRPPKDSFLEYTTLIARESQGGVIALEVVQLRIFTATGGSYRLCRVQRAAWRRPLDVTGLGTFGPLTPVTGFVRAKHPTGVYLRRRLYRALGFYFLFLSQKESSKEKCSLRIRVFRPLRRATRASPWTYRPLEKGGPKLYLARLPTCALINAICLLLIAFYSLRLQAQPKPRHNL